MYASSAAHPDRRRRHPHAHAHLRGFVGVAAEEVRPAFAAEAFLKTALRMTPGLDQVLPPQEPEGAAIDPRLCRRGRPSAALAASAVTVARGRRRLGELETDAATQAAARR
jgi:hypothetical protein